MDKKKAIGFVVLLGLVSLFADITYEGARGVLGPFFQTLGASAAVVGFAMGFGEMIGYTFRLLSGFLSDATKKYWFFTILGYTVNLLVVPALALAGSWQFALALVVLERFGKALRTPARDAMLSYAAENVGVGWAFGLHEAMDQIGAITGPILVSLLLAWKNDYKLSFAFLAVPALAALVFLLSARIAYPKPDELRVKKYDVVPGKLGRSYWVYLVAVMLIAFGFADFPLIGFHLKGRMSDHLIPALYGYAMGVDALSALFFGKTYDRVGLSALMIATGLSAFFAPFAFLGSVPLAIAGVTLWGIGMGAQESIMRAVIADITPPDKRGGAYGFFFTCYGFAWFVGSWIMGILYERHVAFLVAVSVVSQVLAVLILFLLRGGKIREGD